MSNIPADLLQGWDIVVIDDEPDSLEVARYILDFYGASVHTATNWRRGRRACRQGPSALRNLRPVDARHGWLGLPERVA